MPNAQPVINTPSPSIFDGWMGFYNRFITGRVSPKRYLPSLPPESDLAAKEGQLTLEIVSHCWNYSHMLAYQLSSFVNHPPTALDLTVTVFYCEEDRSTRTLLDYFVKMDVPGITWNWQAQPRTHLFRRGIGRNIAARQTQADWVWFTDCDIIFHAQCLDTLAKQLQGRQNVLVYPRCERVTDMLTTDDPMLDKNRKLQVIDIDGSKFEEVERHPATGAYQIVHGDIARQCGYCENIRLYQTPSEVWCKTFEDRAFRWLIGSQGVPIDIPAVHRIRHIEKGRYADKSLKTKIRAGIRKIKFALMNR